MFRECCLQIVLSASYEDRLRGVQGCGFNASTANEEDCDDALDKKKYKKETWPGTGALVHGMEDEFPIVRIESIHAIGKVAQSQNTLKEKCVHVVLEGLQDSHKDVRLAAIKTALICNPKPLPAQEVRLLLETLTSDDSIEVCGGILDFLLYGPEFIDSSVAGVTLEWLSSSKSCSNLYLYQFGRKHANQLYIVASNLEKCRLSCKKGVTYGLAGVLSVWGIPIGLKNEEFITACKQSFHYFVERKTILDKIETILNDYIVSEGRKEIFEHPNVNNVVQFGKEFLACRTAIDRNKLVKSWSGFSSQTKLALNEWKETGIWPKSERFVLKEFNEFDASPPPRKSDFEISIAAEYLPPPTLTVAIARYKILVKGSNVNEEYEPSLRSDVDGRIFKLVVREKRDYFVMYEPVIVPFPFYGNPPKDISQFSLEF